MNRDEEYTAYVTARLAWMHKTALLLCQDRSRVDDLVQTALTRLYVHWSRASAAGNLDGYTRTILVRVFLAEQGSAWWRRVSAVRDLPDTVASTSDQEAAIDLRRAMSELGPRQRAAIVLRYYCDLSVEETADALKCSTGTVKSQTARALATLHDRLTSASWPLEKEPHA